MLSWLKNSKLPLKPSNTAMTDTQQRVAMGYIKGVFGVKGWLKIAANTEHADSLLDYPSGSSQKTVRI